MRDILLMKPEHFSRLTNIKLLKLYVNFYTLKMERLKPYANDPKSFLAKRAQNFFMKEMNRRLPKPYNEKNLNAFTSNLVINEFIGRAVRER